MRLQKLRKSTILKFRAQLEQEEKSPATIEKYSRDVESFRAFLQGKQITKDNAISYKKYLLNKGYAIRSVNSIIVSLNRFFEISGQEIRLKAIRTQREVYCPNEKELLREEYERLLDAANKKKRKRLFLMLQTLCSTGMRVSELRQLTVESVQSGEVIIYSKGKSRRVFLVPELCEQLLDFANAGKIRTGPVFQTKFENPVDRSNVWREMKQLCSEAGVMPSKVYPHNLRHLFARAFYDIDNDIAGLADVMGHNSMDTTRIYLINTGEEQREIMESLHLVKGAENKLK